VNGANKWSENVAPKGKWLTCRGLKGEGKEKKEIWKAGKGKVEDKKRMEVVLLAKRGGKEEEENYETNPLGKAFTGLSFFGGEKEGGWD